MAGLTIANLEWGHRDPNHFIDDVVRSTGILDKFFLVDGIKSKHQFPVVDASLTFGTDICVFDPQSSASINEKEMSVSTYKWAFKNCKNVLQNTYRSEFLRKGMNNAQTMDEAFGNWLYERFAKEAGVKVLDLAATEIKAEITGDDAVIKPTQSTNDLTDETQILGELRAAFKAIPQKLREAIYNAADRKYAPAIFVNANVMTAYQLAVADANKVNYADLQKGNNIPPFLGIPIYLFAPLGDQEIIITPPNNLVMLVDSYADVKAIQATYKPELSSDYLWGQFTIGFSYQRGDNIVYYTGTAA